ncbi:MAG: YkgJ family cysteine cluster protein [Candidatus Omnitrophica bacterium]|nr:YkgJ family cysteine cluster protein [Candidatus Omnitrophota bacterium]MDD5488564.1 YkgJ family cysteine cluster protein [Candidatus Omnitrophota bacterium]
MPCRSCEAKCCSYFAFEIDTPRSKRDFENLRWYLAHEGVSVYVEKRKWHMEVANKCRYLTPDHRCGVYENRPLVCREHEVDTCEFTGTEFEHEKVFKDMDSLDAYIKGRFAVKKRRGKKS